MRDARVGVGLRPRHFPYLLGRPEVSVGFFECISENLMDTEGRPLSVALSLREDYPFSLHGVSLSIGSTEWPRPGYLERLKRLIGRLDPFLVSDHLCWTGSLSHNLHDLLPLPYTRETLSLLVERATRVQEALGREIALENVSAYLSYPESDYAEWDFLAELARRSGCRILLDVNNLYVNAVNQGFDPRRYLDAIPPERVALIHLAGYSDLGTHLFDTHSCPVSEPVWGLYARAAARMPEVPTLIEWDEAIPEFPKLEREALKAARVRNAAHERTSNPPNPLPEPRPL